MTCKPRQIIGNIFNLARDYNRYCGRVIGNLGSLIPVIGWIMDLVKQGSDFTCVSTRTCIGYDTDGPSATERPVLISGIPTDTQCIDGGRWDGSIFHTTDINGNTLSPFIVKSTPIGQVRVFIEFPSYVAGAVLTGDQVVVLTAKGNRVYMTALADDTAISVAVTDADIGSTVADAGGFNWQVEGYATISHGGTQLEGASENLVLHPEDLNNAVWTANDCTIDSAVETYGDLTLDRINVAAGSGSTEIFTTATYAISSGNDNTITVFMKDDGDNFAFISMFNGATIFVTAVIDLTTGLTTDNTVGGAGGIFGSMTAEKVSEDLWRVELTGSLNQVQAKIITGPCGSGTPAYTSGQPVHIAVEGNDLLAGGLQLEEIDHSTSYIPTTTTTLARAATRFADNTVGLLSASSWGLKWVGTPIGAGQTATIFGTYNGANNFTAIIVTATQVILREMVGGVPTDTTETYTHLADTPMEINAKHDGVKIYVRAFSVGDAVPAYHSVNYTTDSQIAATFENCSDGNNADHFSAFDSSMQLDINPANLGL